MLPSRDATSSSLSSLSNNKSGVRTGNRIPYASVFANPTPADVAIQPFLASHQHITEGQKGINGNLTPVGMRKAFREVTNLRCNSKLPAPSFRHDNLHTAPIRCSSPSPLFSSWQAQPKPQPQSKQSITRDTDSGFGPFTHSVDLLGLNQQVLRLRLMQTPFCSSEGSPPIPLHASRHVCISDAGTNVGEEPLVQTLETFGDVSRIYRDLLQTNGCLTVTFYDIRNALQAVKAFEAAPQGPSQYQTIHASFVPDAKVSFVYNAPYLDTRAEATVLVSMFGAADLLKIFNYQSFFQRWGQIREAEQVERLSHKWVVRIEFYDTRAAGHIFSEVQGKTWHDISFRVSRQLSAQNGISSSHIFGIKPHGRSNNSDVGIFPENTPPLTYPFESSLLKPQYNAHIDSSDFSLFSSDVSSRLYAPTQASRSSITAATLSARAASEIKRTQPSSTSAAGIQPLASLETEDISLKQGVLGETGPDVRASSVSSVSAVSNHDHDNAISIQRIADGTDPRTTFMIRNIPNKYTQQMLKDCIDGTHSGQYDFLYLRIDFQNKCNVGYAFINFINVRSVISFAQERVGKRWSRFNSEKRCSLSYANIQGKDALVDKFRNSSVMDEPPSYRPMLFYSSGPLLGQEQPFPMPTVSAETRQQRRRRAIHSRRYECKQQMLV